MIRLYESKFKCCGCTACKCVCSQGAIEMKADGEGFLYPEIDVQKCVECGACEKICAFKNGNLYSNNDQQYYYAKNKSEKELLQSSSGGVFASIIESCMEADFLLAGAAYADDLEVRHLLTSVREGCKSMQGSKYVQSNLRDVFFEVKKALNANRKVLFTGTPCQVDGLKKYLSSCDCHNLTTVDIVCHGVPSPLIWKDYVAFLEKKYKASIKTFTFRDKTVGWKGFNISARFENGVFAREDKSTKTYIDLYGLGYSVRPSCFKCPYTSLNRVSDLTIGDFWGLDMLYPDIDDNKGASMILVNTQKGGELLKKIEPLLISFRVKKEDVLFKQPNLKQPLSYPKWRKQFWKLYHRIGYKNVCIVYTPLGIQVCILQKLKNIVRTKIITKLRPIDYSGK